MQTAPTQRVLLVFAKKPVAGAVKTRLAASIGGQRAAEVYRRMAEAVWREATSADVHTWLVFDPPSEETWMRDWLPDGKAYVAQSSGDLGSRLEAAFRLAFESGAASVAVIGTDAPQLTAQDIENAFRFLDSGSQAVVGPSCDGGYWLLGLSRFESDLFDGIDWSTSRVLDQTLHKIRRHGFTVAALRRLRDIDDLSDLRSVGEDWDHR